MGLIKKDRSKLGVISRKEVEDMIEKAEDLKMKALIATLYLFGMRISEALSIKRSDVSVKDGYLHVDSLMLKRQRRKRRCQVCGKVKTVMKHCKQPTITIPDGESVSKVLPMTHILFCPISDPLTHIIVEQYNIENHDFMFNSYLAPHRPLRRDVAWKKISKINETVYPHLFRHTRLTRLAEAGATDQELTAWAGWKDSKQAGTYVHRSPTMIKKCADKIR